MEDIWWTQDFYNRNPRSAQLRSTGLKIIDTAERLLTEEHLDTETRQNLHGELELLEGFLLEQDIQPGIHVGLTEDDFRDNAVLAAEFVAGQLFPLTGINLSPQEDIRPYAEEFDVFPPGKQSPNIRLITHEDNPPPHLIQRNTLLALAQSTRLLFGEVEQSS